MDSDSDGGGPSRSRRQRRHHTHHTHQHKASPAPGAHVGRPSNLRFTVTEVPPWHVCLILGFQHYLTMLGSTVVIPALLVPAMGGSQEDQARVVQTIFFVSGINTLIQTTIGDRLPIVQGGSFSFLKPAFSIIAIIKATQTFASEHDRFVYTMRELQGSIMGSSVLVMAIGYSGAMGALLRFVSPVVVAPTVCMVGLSLYPVGFAGVAGCMEQGLMAIATVILFSQVLKKVEIPLPRGVLSRPASMAALLSGGGGGGGGGGVSASAVAAALSAGGGGGGGTVRRRTGPPGIRIFELFPLLWSILTCWAFAGILTASGAYDDASEERQATCRTDNMGAVKAAPWLYVPYPLQWGMPIFRPASIVTMAAGALAAMIESTGDYYACARMCGAPVPPPYVISRGIGAEGLGCFCCGLFGTGNGTTSYAENIGAIGLTGVGSRRVVQAGAAIMLGLAVLGKFGALFASLPAAIVAGLFCCVFGLIAAVGLSNLQFTDQNSSRNLMVVGFAIYMALSVPFYFEAHAAAHGGRGPINTSSQHFNDIMNTLFSTPMCVALLIAVIMDNIIAGTPAERGLTHWSAIAHGEDDSRPRRRRRRDTDSSSSDSDTSSLGTDSDAEGPLYGSGGGADKLMGGGGGGDVDTRGLLPHGGAASGRADGGADGAAVYGGSDVDSYDRGCDTEDDPSKDPRNDPRIKAVYDLPYVLQVINDRYILPYRRAMHRVFRRLWRAAARRGRRLWRTMCCRRKGSRSQARTRARIGGGHYVIGPPAGSNGMGATAAAATATAAGSNGLGSQERLAISRASRGSGLDVVLAGPDAAGRVSYDGRTSFDGVDMAFPYGTYTAVRAASGDGTRLSYEGTPRTAVLAPVDEEAPRASFSAAGAPGGGRIGGGGSAGSGLGLGLGLGGGARA